MPLPRNKRPPPKRKVKTVPSLNADPDTEWVSSAMAHFGEMADVEGWEKIISVLSKGLKLPDLKTRSGLKKAHSSFDTIYDSLEQVYFQNSDNIKIIGGVVGIYAQMCVDGLLRDKLFAKGFLKQLTPLLRHSKTLHLALRALLAITHHAGENVRFEIAREYAVLQQCILDFPEDVSCCELALATLSHCLGSVVASDGYFDPEFCDSLPLSSILTTLLKFVQHPDTSKFSLVHLFSLVQCVPAHIPFRPALRPIPHAISFLISNLRSTDLIDRAMTIFSIFVGEGLALHLNEAPLISLDGLIRPTTHTESHYDLANWESSIELETERTWTSAIEHFRQDFDVRKLGVTLAQVVMTAPRIVPSSAWLRANMLPDFKTLAASLRASNRGVDLADLADVLDLSRLVEERQATQAFALAANACCRSPAQPVFYYYQSISCRDQDDIALRALKKGLKCDHPIPSLRFRMLALSIHLASMMGLRQVAQPDAVFQDTVWETAIALLVTALEDSEGYLRDSPPDASHRSSVLSCNLVLRLVLQDPYDDLSVHEADFEAVRKQIDFLAAIQKYTDSSLQSLAFNRTRDIILRLYVPSAMEWHDTIARQNAYYDAVQKSPFVDNTYSSSPDPELSWWTEELHLDTTTARNVSKGDCHSRRIIRGHVPSCEMYKCTRCLCVSSVLRKCACGGARYCDIACQKEDWAQHKLQCASNRGQGSV